MTKAVEAPKTLADIKGRRPVTVGLLGGDDSSEPAFLVFHNLKSLREQVLKANMSELKRTYRGDMKLGGVFGAATLSIGAGMVLGALYVSNWFFLLVLLVIMGILMTGMMFLVAHEEREEYRSRIKSTKPHHVVVDAPLENTITVVLPSSRASIDYFIEDVILDIARTNPECFRKLLADRTMNTILFTKLEKFEQFADELSEPHPDLLPTVRSVLVQRFDPKFYADEVAVIDEQLEKLDSALEAEAVALRATREREEVELRKLRELEESCRPQIGFVTTSETAREVMRAKTDALMSGIVGADKAAEVVSTR